MKKIFPILLVSFIIASVTFFGLWQYEANNQKAIQSLCQASAVSAKNSFVTYKDTKDDSDYWSAIADFRVFEQTYYVLVSGTNKQSNFTFCNEVYSILVMSPIQAQNHIDEIISVMTILASDFKDANGYAQMSNLRNNIIT